MFFLSHIRNKAHCKEGAKVTFPFCVTFMVAGLVSGWQTMAHGPDPAGIVILFRPWSQRSLVGK